MLCAGKERVAEDIFVLASSPPWLAGDRCSHGMTTLAHLPSHVPKPPQFGAQPSTVGQASKPLPSLPPGHRGLVQGT